MLRFKPRFYAQEKDNSCLPACLRIVRSAHGLELSERELRRQCHWSEKHATGSTAVVEVARALGFVHSREDYGLRLYDLRDLLR